jgi:DNA-directed RNA polymerase subunit omega
MLVNLVAKRVRQIREGSDYLVSSPKNEDIVVSLREVAAGKVVSNKAEPQEEAAIEVLSRSVKFKGNTENC